MSRKRAGKVCSTPGCPKDHPCPEHAPKPFAGSTRRSRLPKNWSLIRARILRRDGLRCYRPYPDICSDYATEVDHLVAGDDHRDSNLRAICRPCHQRKSALEGVAARRPR